MENVIFEKYINKVSPFMIIYIINSEIKLMYWFYLFIAIIFEVAATLSIKQVMVTNNSYWIISVVLCYLISFSLVGISVQKIDLGTAYAIWAGMGTTLIVILGWLFFKEEMNLIKILGVGLIILGSIILKLQHS